MQRVQPSSLPHVRLQLTHAERVVLRGLDELCEHTIRRRLRHRTARSAHVGAALLAPLLRKALSPWLKVARPNPPY